MGIKDTSHKAMKIFSIILTALSVFVALQTSSAPAAAEPATEALIRKAKGLTAHQKRRAVELLGRPGHRAMAVSRSGPWGYRYGANTRDEAIQDAQKNCSQHVRKGKYLCEILIIDNDMDMAALDNPRRATQAYRLYNAKSAVEFFGIRVGSYTGNVELAKQNYQRIKQQGSLSGIKRDEKLRKILTETSMVLNRQHILRFGRTQFIFLAKANSGNLRSSAPTWKALEGGLVCSENERWDTGKPIGGRCIIVHSIENGKARVSWAESRSATMRVVVNGDATVAAAR